MQGSPRGFGAIDVLVALAVLGVLLALAVSNVRAATVRVSLVEARTRLTASVFTAQREATLRGKVVMLCPGPEGCRGEVSWREGWRVVVDADGDRALGPRDHVIGRQPALARGVGLTATAGRTRLLFHPNAANAGSNVTFTLCHRDGRVPAQSLVLANDGRLRARPAPPEAGPPCEDTARR